MAKKVIIIIVVAILVIGGVAAWWFLLRPGAPVTSSTSTEVQKASLNRICDSKVVDTYNNVMNYRDQDESSDFVLDEGAIKKLQTDIEGKADFKNDPTCQTILFCIAIRSGDYESAKKAYESVNDLHDDGLFADSNLGSAAPLFVFKSSLDSIVAEGQEGE